MSFLFSHNIYPLYSLCILFPVNDLGTGIHGDGKTSKAADEVVSLIKSKGGVAVPNYGRT